MKTYMKESIGNKLVIQLTSDDLKIAIPMVLLADIMLAMVLFLG